MAKKEYRNILSIWFGAYLTIKRKRAGVTYEEFGESINLSPQYIRMAENGMTSISPGRASDLMTGMQRSCQVEILFTSLSSWLVAIQSIPSHELSDIQRKVETLLTIDNKGLIRLVKQITPIHWDLLAAENYQELKAAFSQTHYIDALETFLTKSDYGFKGVTRIENKWNELYLKAPSVWNTFLDRELERMDDHFKEIRATIPYYNIVQWEQENIKKDTIVSFFGIVNNIAVLGDYIDHYDWSDYFNKKIPFTIFLPESFFKGAAADLTSFYNKMSDSYEKPVDEIKQGMKLRSLALNHIESISKRLKIKTTDNPNNPDSNRNNYFDCWIYTLIESLGGERGFVFDSNDREHPLAENIEPLSELDMENQVYRYRNLTNEQIEQVKEIINPKNNE